MAQKLTKLQMVTGVAYTELPVAEVRMYLAGSSKGGAIDGYEDLARTIPIYIHANKIEYIYKQQVDAQ